MPTHGDTRYEVFWFRHAVVINGRVDPDESRTEKRYCNTVDEARQLVESILDKADRRCASIQKQKYDKNFGWIEVGDQIMIEG